MKDAEAVTFGGAGNDRGAEIRGDEAALANAFGDASARILPIWRGKPLLTEDRRSLSWVAPGHPSLSIAGEAVFLGRVAQAPRFAVDFSAWDAGSEPEPGFFDKSEQRHPDLPEGAVFAELRGGMTLLSAEEAELAATAKALLGWHATHHFCARCGAASKMSQGGWQRICPDCGASHFPRTDPVVIMLITRGNDVLVGRSPGWPDGMYSLLAGFVEPGETVEAAVRREVMEETQVRVGDVRYLASQPWPFPSSLMIGCQGYASTTDIVVDPVELDDAVWVSRETMAEVVAGRGERMWAARKGSIARFLIERWLADRLE